MYADAVNLLYFKTWIQIEYHFSRPISLLSLFSLGPLY